MADPKAQPRIACNAGCGVTVADDAEAETRGWSWLMVARGWRCRACIRALTAASGLPGTPARTFVDAVPADSRGALRKETATTITPPSVKC
jgi:hypothetical protein